jgi:hypothetical protein
MWLGGTASHDHLVEAEAEVRHLREELETFQKVQAELRECLVNAIGGADLT